MQEKLKKVLKAGARFSGAVIRLATGIGAAALALFAIKKTGKKQ